MYVLKILTCAFVFLHHVLLLQGFENMNGDYNYVGRTPHQGKGNYSTNFSKYPGGVEYFEVYAGPINTTYVALKTSHQNTASTRENFGIVINLTLY